MLTPNDIIDVLKIFIITDQALIDVLKIFIITDQALTRPRGVNRLVVPHH